MLHQYFKTPEEGGAIRSYYLAKALATHGHQVVVITSGSKKKYHTENLEGIEVHYLPIAYDNRFGFYARGLAFIRFMVSSARLSEKFKDADYCYAISVPLTVGRAAQWIKFRYGIPYFFEVGDLWPDAPIQMGFVRNPFLKRALYYIEKSIYQGARSIVVLSPAIQAAIERKVTGKKIWLIPNMADCDYFLPEEKKPALENKFDVSGKFVISYVGALGVANGLDYFLACAQASRNYPNFHFILCGDGAMRESLSRDAGNLYLNNLTILDFVNREGVKEIMNVTDAVFVCYKPVPILETGSPNKYFDGLAAGKLIIINFGGWIKMEIEEEQCGVYIDPMEPEDFVKKMEPFVSNRDLIKPFQLKARQLAERKYSRKLLSESFSKIFS